MGLPESRLKISVPDFETHTLFLQFRVLDPSLHFAIFLGFYFLEEKNFLYFLKQEKNSRQKISFCSKIHIFFFSFFVLYICNYKRAYNFKRKKFALKISSWLVSKFWISVPGISEEDKFFKLSWKKSKRKLLFRRLIFQLTY